MGKGIATYNSLIGLYRHIHQRANHAARRINLLCVDIGCNAEIRVGLKDHCHLLKRSVTGALTDTIDGYLNLTCTIEYTCYRIGCSHTEVIMTMGRENATTCGKGIYVLVEIFDFFTILVGSTKTRCVGDVTYRSTCLAYCLYDTCKVLVVGTSSVFGIELNVFYITLGILYCCYRTFNNLLWGTIKFVFDVRRTCANTCMYATAFCIFQCFGCYVYIFLYGTSESTDGRPCYCLTDFNDRIEVSRATYGESCFDDIDTQGFQLLGHLNLLYRIELTSGHLLAIAQCGIEDI